MADRLGMDGAVEDLRKLGVKSWWMITRDREFYRKLRPTAGCRANNDDEADKDKSLRCSHKPLFNPHTNRTNPSLC
jgi:hypothetical protein